MRSGQIKGHVAIFLSCIVFASNIIASNALMGGDWMTPMGYTTVRLTYGAVIFWIIGLFVPKEKVAPKDLGILAIGGVLGFIVSQFAFASALRYTTPVNFSLIMAMSPVVVFILSVIFLKEKVLTPKVIGIVLSVVGAFLIIIQRADGSAEATNNALGVFIAFLSMSSYGIYLMITREVTQKYASVTIMKWTFLFTAIIILPFGWSELGSQKIFSSAVTIAPVLQLVFILIFDATLVFYLLLFSLKKLKTTTVSTYLNMLPIFTAVIAVIDGQEVFSFIKVLATFLVIGGVFLVTRSSDVEEEASDTESEATSLT